MPESQPIVELIDPRFLSKRDDPDGRAETAKIIVENRRQQQELGRASSKIAETIRTAVEGRPGLYARSQDLAEREFERKKLLLVRLKEKIGIHDRAIQLIEAELADVDAALSKAFLVERDALQEQSVLEAKQAALPKAKDLLQAYYEKISITPLTQEEKRECLVPDLLSSLSMEEYVLLWKRLNPHFLTHVTRQGFRDHNAMTYHSAGMKDFHSGFTGVLADGKMNRPPMYLGGLRSRDESSVKDYITEWVLEAEDVTESKRRFDSLLNFSLASAPSYPDKTAVHLSAQLVADDYYGGETGNETFFIYPSDVIASQHNFAFNGWQRTFIDAQSETKWNDIFVWSNNVNNPGISIDSGIVFLPKNARVDKVTGSKYASKSEEVDGLEKKVMVHDVELQSTLLSWASAFSTDSDLGKSLVGYKKERNYYSERAKYRDCVDLLSAEMQQVGFTADAALDLSTAIVDSLPEDGKITADLAERSFEKSGAQYKRAEDPISSMEYWENYFSEHPDEKPKHIYYYDGDPTTAVYRFQRDNNIGRADTSKSEGPLLGFDDHHVTDMKNDPRSNEGYEELYQLGISIIEKHFEVPAESEQPEVSAIEAN